MIPNQHIFIIYRTFREEVFMELSFTTWPLMTDRVTILYFSIRVMYVSLKLNDKHNYYYFYIETLSQPERTALSLQNHSCKSKNGQLILDWNSQILLIVVFSLENKQDIINSQFFVNQDIINSHFFAKYYSSKQQSLIF